MLHPSTPKETKTNRMKQKILYILLLIATWIGGTNVVWGQTDVDGYKRTTSGTITYNPTGKDLNKFNGDYVMLSNETNINTSNLITTFKIGSSINWYSVYSALRIYEEKENTISWEINNSAYIFNLKYLSMLMRATLEGSVTFTSSQGDVYTSGNIYATSPKFDVGLTEIDLGIDDFIKFKTKDRTWIYYYIYEITCKYTLSYYELITTDLDEAIENAGKITQDNLDGKTKTAFTEALTNANTVKAESAFPTSYWNNGSQGLQDPETVKTATNNLNNAIALAEAYIAAKEEINGIKTQEESWPDGLSVNIDNALTALNNATTIDGINAAKNKISIDLDRSFVVGYSTLTIPFDYDIEYNIPNAYAAQLALVTYNKTDGYTLYFQKVADGIMRANQPYVIWLPSEITKAQWLGVEVAFEDAGSVSTARTQGWTMQGNYTPGVSMEGMYGIAGGKMCEGTAGSFINAYTAYFVPPTAAGARVRMAVLGDDGGVTYIDDIRATEDEREEMVYRLDGVRTEGLGKGVNIVRMKDGSVRKVIK